MVFANVLSWGADNFFPIMKGFAIVCAGIVGLGKLYDGSQSRKRQAEAVRTGRPELLRQLVVALTALHERELLNEAGDDGVEDHGAGNHEAAEHRARGHAVGDEATAPAPPASPAPPAFDPSAWGPPSAPPSAGAPPSGPSRALPPPSAPGSGAPEPTR